MPLEVEDGTGRADAESVLSVDDVDAMALREAWPDWPAAGLQIEAKEAAIRKANRWAESRYGARLRAYVGSWASFYALPISSTQARLFPISGYIYPDGRRLTIGDWLPREWALVVGLAARRAFNGTLSPDLKRGGRVIQKVVGPLSTTWEAGAPAETSFPEIDDAAAPLWFGVGVMVVKG